MLDAVVQGVQFLRGGGVHQSRRIAGRLLSGFTTAPPRSPFEIILPPFARCKIGPAALRSPASDLPAGYRRPRKPLQGSRRQITPSTPKSPLRPSWRLGAAGCPQTGVWGGEKSSVRQRFGSRCRTTSRLLG